MPSIAQGEAAERRRADSGGELRMASHPGRRRSEAASVSERCEAGQIVVERTDRRLDERRA
jgi:hypothetical protein